MPAAPSPRILFLDDDHVLKLFRMLLRNEEAQASFAAWFAPERPDLSNVLSELRGLRRSEGALAGLASEEPRLRTDADAIVFRRGIVDDAMLARHPRLRVIARLGERPEGIDLDAARRRDVRVVCMPRATLQYTAEHALLLMLACAKRLPQSDAAVRAGALDVHGKPAERGDVAYNWAGLSDATGLHARTLGIVGLGEVGSLVAKLARAFGMTVLYTKPTRASAAQEEALGVQYAPLPDLLRSSDFVSLHAPNQPQTQGLADAEFFAGMRPGAFFINTSRGALVNEDALYEALVSGRLGGAGLDVHGMEPRPPRDRFLSLHNVLLTPHLGGGARSGVLREFATMAKHMRQALQLE
jgi:phosphoglycerate dehydrogenase-like enzyme